MTTKRLSRPRRLSPEAREKIRQASISKSGLGSKARNVNPVLAGLREIRIEKGMTQTEVADKAGYGHHLISTSEEGSNDPKLSSVINWAQALGYDLVLKPNQETLPDVELQAIQRLMREPR